jgi:hypothetical protein
MGASSPSTPFSRRFADVGLETTSALTPRVGGARDGSGHFSLGLPQASDAATTAALADRSSRYVLIVLTHEVNSRNCTVKLD